MKKAKKKNILKRILNIVANAIVILFFIICVMVLVISVTSKKNKEDATNVFGYQIRTVISPSMEKCDLTDVSSYKIKDIPVKSMVFIELAPSGENELQKWYGDLKIGDVLTFKYVYAKQETITHRIISIDEKSTGGYIIELEGDNKNSDISTLSQMIDTSKTNSPNYIVGKVVRTSYVFGLLVTSAKTPIGAILIIFIPCLIIIGYEIYHIVSVVNESKKRKILEVHQQKDIELERLKQQIYELQKKSH